MPSCLLSLAVCICLTVFQAFLFAQTPDYAWIEGEIPSSANWEVTPAAWGNAQYLSQESWLHLQIPADKVEEGVPAEGIVIRYDFNAPSSGNYEVWGRLGFEFVRTPFEWRVDDGEWHTLDPNEQLSTDLMELARWNEVAWVQMGKATLSAGLHSLQTRHRPHFVEKDGKQEAQQILYAADAFCLFKGAFHPNGKHRPDADWQTEEDRNAAAHVFQMPAEPLRTNRGELAGRTELSLVGTWQIARFDEVFVQGRTQPMSLPESPEWLYWSAIRVPGDRDTLRPDLKFCHRYFYRTRVQIPASYEGQSFFLDFTETSMLTTVFVDGQQVAFHDAPLTGFLADITNAVRPGEVNEIWVGIKDAYYAIEPTEDRPNTRHWFNTPTDMMERNQGVTMRFDYPMKGHLRNGITDSVKLVATGKMYVEDVFATPSVKNKELGLEITLRNPTGTDLDVDVRNVVAPLGGGAFEVWFGPLLTTVPAHDTITVNTSEHWENPKLWWPDDPYQYEVLTVVTLNGLHVDGKHTKFGFREWSIEGTRFMLNGVPWQFRANLDYYGANKGQADEAVNWWHQSAQNMFRLRFQETWGGMTQNQALDFFDANGIPVRRTCSTFDGQHASYGLVEFVERDGERVKVPRKTLFDNWRKQIAARIRQQRNHPSIFVWELDNEIIYINTRNFGNLDVVEPEFTKAAQMIQQIDTQHRGVMVAGGRALMDQSLPINGCHYEESPVRDYPDMAYGLGEWTAQSRRQPWPMALDKPIFLSETFFSPGWKPGQFAAVGGEQCFVGRAETRDANALLARMFSEGYRWQHLAAFQYWFGKYGDAHYNSWQPVVALCREWNWTFGSGSNISRTIKILNDTHGSDPIEVEWALVLLGILNHHQRFEIAPGQDITLPLELRMPEVTQRTEGRFVLRCFRDGQKIWENVKPLSVIPTDAAPKPNVTDGQIIVWDPQGAVSARLQARGIPHRSIDGLSQLPDDFRLLVVGPDALTPRQATDPFWRRLAAEGKRILVLDQTYPLHYHAVPADFEVTDYVGRVAFAENLDHPIFAGLAQQDFFTWSNDHIVYRNVYRKASHGARSLAQCDDYLSCSAIAECPVNEGLMLLCQMVVGTKLAYDPVAQRLFDNLLNYALEYKLIRNTTAVVLPDIDPRMAMIGTSGLKHHREMTPLQAITDAQNGIVIVDATPEHLAELAQHQDAVRNFTKRGGWLMLWNVSPDGLSDFDQLVSVTHVMRPFRRELVSLPAVRDPLTSGLSQRDVVLYSGERIFGWVADEYVADDMFTYVVDLNDIAPFTSGPGIEGTNSIVNGLTSTEAWKYIYYMSMQEDGSAPTLTLTFPREETVTGFSIVPNAHYWRMRRIKLVFDADESTAQVVELAEYTNDANDRQDFELRPVRAKSLMLVPVGWDQMPGRAILGIDNLWLQVARPQEFPDRVKPLLNMGALVKYPQGKGGIVLNQLNIVEREAVPINAQKKLTILSTILRNLNAVFSGEKRLLPGENLDYEPVSLEDVCNLYIASDRGWPDKDHDLSHLPLDRQRFGGVVYDIRNFKASPLESAVTLQGLPGVQAEQSIEIDVHRKADALFFLHTFYQRDAWRPRRGTDTPPVIWQYVVHYANDSDTVVPVYYGQGAADWKSDMPQGLKDASLAWAAPFPGAPEQSAVLHQLQWDNPHSAVEIRSIEMRYDEQVGNRYGSPVLLGITTATRKTSNSDHSE